MAGELAVRGGPPVRPGGYPAWPVHDERDVRAVAEAMADGPWGGHPEPGLRAARFAERFAAYQGARHGVALANGTVGLEVALRALGIGWRDEVIVPCVTFAATAAAVMAAGALPVLVDVDPRTLTIDPAAIGPAVTPRTRAVVPVHLGQHLADLDEVLRIAAEHSLAVVEDAAQAHGQRWRDAGAGCLGVVGSFSHQDSKALTSGEGGSLLTGDEELARRAHSIVDCGRPKGTAGPVAGVNYRLTELQAALLLVGLDRLPGQQAERAAAATVFEKLAAGVPGVTVTPRDPRITRSCFSRFQLLVDPEDFAGAGAGPIRAALEAEGVPCWAGFPPVHRTGLFDPGASRLPVAVEHRDRLDPRSMTFPVADALAGRGLFLRESVFRAGEQGVRDAVDALAKVQERAAELPGG